MNRKSQLAMAALAVTWFISGMAQAQEPITPITPVKDINLARWNWARSCFLIRDYPNPVLFRVIPATT